MYDVLTTCVSVNCLHAQCPQEQKQTSDALELELKMGGSCHVSVGNRTQVLTKAFSALNH